MGLRWPVASSYHVTQGFDGDAPQEPAGWLHSDAIGPEVCRATKLSSSVYHAHLHGAIDVALPVGTPIVAPEAGKLVEAGTYASTGEHYAMLEIQPGTIVFVTHLSKVRYPVGRRVARGEVFAYSGNSGMSTGPHLHFEVRRTSTVGADPRLSSSWAKWNPQRLRVGGDLAGAGWIRPG